MNTNQPSSQNYSESSAPNSTNPSVVGSPKTQKRTRKKVVPILIGIILVTLTALVFLALPYLRAAVNIVTAVREYPQACNDEVLQADSQIRQYEAKLRVIKIDGQAPSIKSTKSAACGVLTTGSRNPKTVATYTYAAPIVTVADQTVIKALGATKSGNWTINHTDAGDSPSSEVPSLQDTITSSDGTDFEVAYIFNDPVFISCDIAIVGHSCTTNEAISTYKLLSMPVKAVTITLREYTARK